MTNFEIDNDIMFDRTKRDLLRVQYKVAISEGHDQFEFEGHTILTSYAKYLLEFLDEKLGR